MTERDREAAGEPAGRDAQASRDPSDSPTVAWTPAPDRAVAEPPATPEAPVTVEPVASPSRGGRARWVVALAVTALVAAGGIAAVVLLTGQTAPSTVVGYAPSHAVVYGEVRLDLPGDQRQKLGEFLSRFPGFADQSTLDVKIDDVLDRIVRAASEDRQDWSTKIKPWFGGQMGFTVSPPASGDAEDARFLAILTVTDANRARAWFDEVTTGVDKTTADHDGTQITVLDRSGKAAAMAIADGRVMLVGDEQSVRDSITSHGRGDLGADEDFKAALAALEGDSLGYAFVDYRGLASLMETSGAQGLAFQDVLQELSPAWLVMRMQARGDAVALESVIPHPEIGAPDENRASALAAQVPPTTFVLIDGHDAGAAWLEVIARLRQEPEMAEAFKQIDQVLGILGGEQGALAWIGDAGFALARDADGVHGGLVFRPADRAGADRLLTTLRSFVALGGSSMGVSTRDETYNDVKMTVIDVGDLRDLAGGAGLPPGAELPAGRLEIAYATTSDVVVVGVGPSFVRAVLDAGPGPSLADEARYRGLIDRVGADNTGQLFVDVTAIRELVEKLGAGDPEDFATYEREIKPYVQPLDAIVQATVRDGDLDRTTMVVTVK